MLTGVYRNILELVRSLLDAVGAKQFRFKIECFKNINRTEK